MFVEIVFGKINMTESEVREFVSQFIQDTNYEIKSLEPEDDGTIVIIRFSDTENAKSFIEEIRFSEEIRSVDYIYSSPISFSEGVLVNFFLLNNIFFI